MISVTPCGKTAGTVQLQVLTFHKIQEKEEEASMPCKTKLPLPAPFLKRKEVMRQRYQNSLERVCPVH